ncbi:MAG: hypothetical protein COA74_01610 [Gammaproteobacteria bacterium]|nr:MAG: hypothetical protein COA74_01610 [Gammaproteobacteria bacterium]
MYSLRRVMVSNAKAASNLYHALEAILVFLNPVWKFVGLERIDKAFSFIERNIKGLLFDCQMCGYCVLDKTGMSCPMNCPKQIRNGPCGGVRDDGNCEVKPEMRCVWLEAWRGAKKLDPNTTVVPDLEILSPVDQLRKGHSSWLIKVQEIQSSKVSVSHD